MAQVSRVHRGPAQAQLMQTLTLLSSSPAHSDLCLCTLTTPLLSRPTPAAQSPPQSMCSCLNSSVHLFFSGPQQNSDSCPIPASSTFPKPGCHILATHPMHVHVLSPMPRPVLPQIIPFLDPIFFYLLLFVDASPCPMGHAPWSTETVPEPHWSQILFCPQNFLSI